jgi:hypothetical protein
MPGRPAKSVPTGCPVILAEGLRIGLAFAETKERRSSGFGAEQSPTDARDRFRTEDYPSLPTFYGI